MGEAAGGEAGKRPRKGALDRAEQRERIVQMVGLGVSYRKIGVAENLSHERVRQIAKEELAQHEALSNLNHQRLQILRLGPSLNSLGKKTADGDPRAVAAFLRVLDKLDKYQVMVGAADAQKGFWRKRLSDKLENFSRRNEENKQAKLRREQAALPAPQAEPDAAPQSDAVKFSPEPNIENIGENNV